MAYRSARQAGEMDHPAFMAAMKAYGYVYELINGYDLYHSLYPTGPGLHNMLYRHGLR